MKKPGLYNKTLTHETDSNEPSEETKMSKLT